MDQTDEISLRAPAEHLKAQARSVLYHAVDAQRCGLKVYESLQNLNEVIGTEYGDRVLYELIQNAHDAHRSGDEGRIAIRLVVTSETDGVLYIANGGRGFRKKDVEAIRNLAISAKDVGEGIGNKGLGFRSIEALTDDVQIYSRRRMNQADRFDGYCFRFAKVEEIEGLLRSYGAEIGVSQEVARTVPRYLVPMPLDYQPENVVFYARRGYATVIVAPLRTAGAVALATAQVEALANLDVPLLLFLDRIAEIRVDVETPEKRPYQRRLRRRQTPVGNVPSLAGTRMYKVEVSGARRFLVIRRDVDKERVRAAVKSSISKVPQLKRWLNWKGQPVVSVAVGLSSEAVTRGRLYNFLPMGKEAASPLMGYLDAPFFTDINRRNAALDLPLNETLMEAAAEACAAAALSIVEHDMPIPSQAVFDLFAWTGAEAGKLDYALKKVGSSLCEARVIPTIAVEGTGTWSSLSEVSIWPEGSFAVLKDREVAKHVGALLVSGDLDSRRLARLREVANRTFHSLSPSGQCLAAWSETFARSLRERKVAPRTWSRFYEDLNCLFDAADANLEALDGKSILYDRSGRLRNAGGYNGAAQAGVFVRSEVPKGRRARGSIPLPPSTLTRRYRFLDKRIKFQQETLDAFIEAGLVQEYDPVKVLAGLKSALGKNPNDNRRREALVWAFRVWQTPGVHTKDEIQSADLHVPTLTGWRPASDAAFPASWTSVGQTLENFLVDAAEVSVDCRQARDLLLISYGKWPVSAGDTKKQWKEFLELIGVVDGLRPVAARVQRQGEPAYFWNELLHDGDTAEGLDSHWCAEVAKISFNHPYTSYSIDDGEAAWRLPGQIEHDDLPETAKEGFCTLAFEHLKVYGTKSFRFQVGRFGRKQRDWDDRTLPTPLAIFLRARSWIAASTQDGPTFRQPNECWAARVRRGGPPRFMDRVPDHVSDLTQSDELAELAFGEDLGLRDWQSRATAVYRLMELTAASGGLASSDRPLFRREYQRAWQEVVDSGVSLPTELTLAVNRRSRLEKLEGDARIPPNVIVTQDAQRFEARVLSSAGQAVLEVGEISTEKVTELLRVIGTFVPRRLDGVGVRLLVDDESFEPRVGDALLTSLGLSWLPEVAVLGHELRGEQLERGIQTETVDRRVRSIRVRHCKTISLVVDEDEIASDEHLSWYAFDHTTLPTLILTESVSLDWRTLASSLSSDISRLIDGRLRSLKPLLLQLALECVSDELDAPSDEALAKALECDVQTVQDHRAALQTDLCHILHLLMPVVGYFNDVELARQLRNDAEGADKGFDVVEWLQTAMAETAIAPQDMISACEQAADRTALRRDLDLDYEKFNRVLLELDEPPLSNEAELRQLYDAYLEPMRPAIIDRLRRHYIENFRKGLDLSVYVERKTLAFLLFDQAWVLTRESLDREVVEAHVSKLLDETLGDDRPGELPAFPRLIEGNRKVVREFAKQAIPVLSVWCRRNGASVPEPWDLGTPQAVARHVENAGLLDFEPVTVHQGSKLCHRANSWPDGMPETLDNTELGFDVSEVEEEDKRRERERQRSEIERRSINFAGHSLDTGDPSFAETLQKLAEERISRDETWYERSRSRPRLVKFESSDQPGGVRLGGGRGGGARMRKRQLTDAQRQAMGLASEWLAFQFLSRHHGETVDETCWVSENRARFFGGAEGDDSAGYDFLVKTKQAEWLYEVKSSLEDSGEFELTANELRIASGASKDRRRRYRILYVPFVFSPDKWCVLELPNPMGEKTCNRFSVVGSGSVRLRFERQ